MPRLVHRNPRYCKNKFTGQAVVSVGGKTIPLGPYGSVESRQAYDRVVAEWITNGRRLPPPRIEDSPLDITICELIDRFWDHVISYYRNQATGKPTSEVDCFRTA